MRRGCAVERLRAEGRKGGTGLGGSRLARSRQPLAFGQGVPSSCRSGPGEGPMPKWRNSAATFFRAERRQQNPHVNSGDAQPAERVAWLWSRASTLLNDGRSRVDVPLRKAAVVAARCTSPLFTCGFCCRLPPRNNASAEFRVFGAGPSPSPVCKRWDPCPKARGCPLRALREPSPPPPPPG